MPLVESVILPMFGMMLDADKKVFTPPELQEKAGLAMLTELARWTDAMRPLRGR
jgi:hypothetical protein